MSYLINSFSPTLLTDFYQLTMAYGYWKAGRHEYPAVFHMNFRRSPFNGSLAIAAGLGPLIEVLRQYRFTAEDLDFLKMLKDDNSKPYFCHEFIDYLRNLEFSWDIDAIEEGEVVFAHEPLIRVKGPLLQCQLLESLLLNIINFQTLIATKAARLYIAAQGEPVVEFGFRRAQGLDGAVSASRAAYIGGCVGTSNVLASKLFNIPLKGTQAHSWILSFDDELSAFDIFAKTQPDNCLFLVDTYNSIRGIEHAISIGHKLRSQNKQLLGIRLDSGDLAYLSIMARKMLDEAGFNESIVLASNELDELIIRDLIQQGAKINVWGVGTNLVTSKGHPALDGVYKLAAIREHDAAPWKYKLKISEQMMKTTNPGVLQVRRFSSGKRYIGDVIYNEVEPPKTLWQILDPLDPTKKKTFEDALSSNDLLVPIFRKGKVVYQPPSLTTIRDKMVENLTFFHSGLKRFLYPHQYPVGLEKGLYDLKTNLIDTIRQGI